MRYLPFAIIALPVLGIAVWWAVTPARPPAPAPGPDIAVPANTDPSSASEPELPPGVRISFADVTAAAGIQFQHVDGRTDMEYLMDSTGPGAAWIDYDQDGLLDLFLVQGSAVIPPYSTNGAGCKLYRNLGNGKFEDVTTATCVGHVGCGQGVAVGDIDNDGFPDLFVTCYGKTNVLYPTMSRTAKAGGGSRISPFAAGAQEIIPTGRTGQTGVPAPRSWITTTTACSICSCAAMFGSIWNIILSVLRR